MVELKTNQYDLNPQLLELVAGIAEARTVLISEWHGIVPKQGVTHYITESLVVEQAFEDGVYKFVILPDATVMTARLANQFGFPQEDSADLTFILPKEAAARAKAHAKPDELIAIGILPTTATQLTETYRKLTYQGTVRVLRTALGKVQKFQLLGFVASERNAWLMEQGDEAVRYVSADVPAFQKQITRMMIDVHREEA